MARLYPDDVGTVRCFDEAGREVKDVWWYDPETETFGQMVRDQDGKKVVDLDRLQPEVNERIGRLTLIPIENDDAGAR